MTWQCTTRLAGWSYGSTEERGAYTAGYSDGFYGYAMWASNERNWYPNAYSKGYHEGAGDKATLKGEATP